MLAPGRPSTNRLRARENAVRASSWRCTSASVGSTSARRISSENAGRSATPPRSRRPRPARDPPLGPFEQVAQRLHPGHQPWVEHQRRTRPGGSIGSTFPGRGSRGPVQGSRQRSRPALPEGVAGRRGRGRGRPGTGRPGGRRGGGTQLARVEAAEGRGEQGREQLAGPGRVEAEAEQVEDVPDDRLGHELALARAQPVGDAEPLQGPAGGRAEPPGRRQQDGHPAVGDAVPFVGDPEEAGVGLRLLGGTGVAGGLHGRGATPLREMTGPDRPPGDDARRRARGRRGAGCARAGPRWHRGGLAHSGSAPGRRRGRRRWRRPGRRPGRPWPRPRPAA